MTSQATRMAPERSQGINPSNATPRANPTEVEIAAVAFQLWVESGCHDGFDREHWFQAEAMLKSADAAKRQEAAMRPLMQPREVRCDSELFPDVASGFCWGHWEVWEREWGGARWVWDVQVGSRREVVAASRENKGERLAKRASA